MKHLHKQIFVREQQAEYSAKTEHGGTTIPIHEAKSNLSKLVKRAAAGETVYIGAYGKPEAAIVPVNAGKYRAELRAKAFGCMRQKMKLPENWDAPLPDVIIDSFYSMRGLEDFKAK
ncbi:MAG: type II toxin-antitoxin system prevent-host-death family antitoxin [Treponema sp.]|jgi:prevent-host-death family protein|nr:type II toxin-antitoxin system prevent-host-death family antitoxin [Treponema sp.]